MPPNISEVVSVALQIHSPVSLKSKLPGATSENRARQLDLRIEDWKLAWSNGTKGR
jgi:hypothetical protein